MSAATPTDMRALGLFEGYGVEIEYAIVDRESLAVRPLADRLLRDGDGVANEIERGAMAWSNELALHVIELKTNGPAPRLAGLAERFQAEVAHADVLLAALGARLLPTGMHPLMDPERDFALWPHGDRAVYEAFHRIFDCRGHGWSNLQSAHLNLPFDGDEELRRLHDAVRLLLPLLPALAASSPLREGRVTGLLDTRLDVYRTNARRLPSVTGRVVPERVRDRAGYEREILAPIYRDLAPLDPQGLLRHEWVNARGAIARFDRGAVEIRVLDTQECPQADLAVAAAATCVLRGLVEDAGAGGAPEPPPVERLEALLRETTARAGEARVDDADLLGALGLPPASITAREAWRALLERHAPGFPDRALLAPVRDVVLEEGCLARRILRRLGAARPDAAPPRPERVREVYAELTACLVDGRLFRATA